MPAMSKPARTKSAKTTDEPLEKLLDDGSKGFRDLVQKRIRELLIEQITTLRQKRGWSQAMLAARAGVKQPFIARLESGNFTNIELRTLVRIADALNANIEIRLTDDERVPARATVENRLHT
jgi:ribosome-binding protein aMBF1 (putative translation factor)